MKRILILCLLCVPLHCIAETASRPNIVLILADDVGCEPIGAYGGERWKTPNIDALARGGVKFDFCFSMPVCHPTRITLLTGHYPFRLNSSWGTFPKGEEQNTIAARLQRAGYRTAVAGKWQLCMMKDDLSHPKRLGFDQWQLFGWHEGARYHDPFIYENGKRRTDTAGLYGPDLYVDFLGDFMERCVDDDQPFFAFYSMTLAHDVTDDLPVQVPYVPGKDRWMDYGEMIVSMDEMVGRLVAKIDQLGIRNNTVIFFTGDNGTSVRSKLRHTSGQYENENVYSVRNGERVPGGKGTLKDIGTNVPLVANWPKHIPAGAECRRLVDFSDWLPTLLEVAGVKSTENQSAKTLDGHSFAPLLTDPLQPSPRKYAFAEGRGGKAWVRTQRFKLYEDGRFFDVAADPMEENPKRQPEASVYDALQNELNRLGFNAK